MNMNLEPVTLVGGQKILGHRRCDCESQEHCCVHKPSDHHMVTWTQNWRQDTGVMERICPCGVGHPDPDHIAYVRSKLGDKVADTQLVHGCCGCCSQAPKTPRKTPRKSMAEIRAEERSRGFEEAMRFFEEAWRDRVWNVARGKMGHDPHQ